MYQSWKRIARALVCTNAVLFLSVGVFGSATGCAYSKWNSRGISKEEAVKWESAGIDSPDDASEWRGRGLSSEDAAEYKRSNIGPNEAVLWKAGSISGVEAASWSSAEIGASEAIEWKQHGVPVNEAVAWKHGGYSPEKALLWRSCGFLPGEVDEWIIAGFDPNDANWWRAHDKTPSEMKSWKRFGREHSLTNELVLGWIQSGLTPEECGDWLVKGLDSTDAVELRAHSFTPETYDPWRPLRSKTLIELQKLNISSASWADWYRSTGSSDLLRWLDSGFGVSEAVDFTGKNISIEDATKWKENGFDAPQAFTFQQAGVGTDKAIRWKDAGLAAEEAIACEKANVDVESYLSWSKDGFSSSEMLVYSNSGIDQRSALPWKKSGISPSISVSFSINGFTPIEAKKWLKYGFNAEDAHQCRSRYKSPDTLMSRAKTYNFSMEDIVSTCGVRIGIDEYINFLNTFKYDRTIARMSSELSRLDGAAGVANATAAMRTESKFRSKMKSGVGQLQLMDFLMKTTPVQANSMNTIELFSSIVGSEDDKNSGAIELLSYFVAIRAVEWLGISGLLSDADLKSVCGDELSFGVLSVLTSTFDLGNNDNSIAAKFIMLNKLNSRIFKISYCGH